MNRERFAWSMSVGLLVVLALEVPGSLAQRDDDYGFVRTLLDVRREVSRNYVEPVDEKKLHDAAIAGMLSSLDPFSEYFSAEARKPFDRQLEGKFPDGGGIGVRLEASPDGTVEILSPVDGSPAGRAGVVPGDVFVSVDGKSVAGVKVDELRAKILGPPGTTVVIGVRHPDGRAGSYSLKREEFAESSIQGFGRDAGNRWVYWASAGDKIGYVRLKEFVPSSYDDLRGVMEALIADGMKGFILDLRFDGGGQLEQAEKIVNMLVPADRPIVMVRGRARPESTFVSNGEGMLPKFPMVVLVNGQTASAAEIVSGSLKDNGRAVIVGSRTFGKGSVQELLPLDEDGGELKLTVAYYYLPSGRLVHRKVGSPDWGVVPDVTVAMDPGSEERLYRSLEDRDLYHRLASTMPTSQPATVEDPQLKAGITSVMTMLAMPPSTTGPASRPGK